MVEDAFYNRFFTVDVIVSDNDSTMRAVIKHHLIGVPGQVMKTSNGKLDEEIPDPSFLADPSHRVKVVSKHIFSIVNESRAQRCGCTKADDLLIKKDWGYMIKNNREKTIEELSEASKAPLGHMFNSRANCSAEWCFKTRASEEGKTYNNKDEKIRCKQNDNQLYNLPKNNSFPIQTEKVLKESLHMFDTEKKSMNNVIAYVAPKNKTMAHIMSLK